MHPASTAAHRKAMKMLAVSGSLRAHSTNTALLRATALVAPSPVRIVLYEELATIPPFNPDLDKEPAFEPVSRLRAALRDSAAVIFSTPEYAHGIPGALKNALDWIVGSGELSGKPVALFNASSRGEYAQASLKEVIRTMDAQLISEAEITLSLLGKDIAASTIAANPQTAALILPAIQKLASRASLAHSSRTHDAS